MATPRVPDRPSLEGLEERWAARWEEEGTYRFDPSRDRSEVYSIDTPPPTVSGSLHVGHVFSYTQTDIVARYQRMTGKAVFYPIGWDDNGLPTERRVQDYFGVSCDPSLPYDPDFVPPLHDAKRDKNARAVPVSRPNFVELCNILITEDEQAFEQLFRKLGASVDWTQHYTTISEASRRASQRGFLRLLARGEAYRQEAPTLWDVDFQTAVAQAELVDKEDPGFYHRLRFARRASDGPPVEIETTRPELVPGLRRARRPSRRRALPGPVRHRGADAAVRCPGPGPRPRACRAGQGIGHRHDLHLRRPHRRDVVARPLPADPLGGRAGTAVSGRRRSGRPAGSRSTRNGRTRSTRELEGLTDQARPGTDRRAAARVRATSLGEPRADHPRRQVLRTGQAALSRSSPPRSGTCGPSSDARRSSPEAASSTGTPSTCGPVTRRGWKA